MNLEEMTDDKLIEVAKGNGSLNRAINELFRRHRFSLQSFIIQRVYDIEESEDIVQETFLNVSRYISNFKGKSSFKTWLYTIAKNRISNYYQKKNKKPTENMEDNFLKITNLPTKSLNPEQKFAVTQKEEWIASLSEKFRESILLRGEGFSYKEIADSLGIPINTARTRVHHARKKIGEYPL